MQDHVLFHPFLDLAEAWRQEGAYQLDRYGDTDRAHLYESTASDLIEVVQALPDRVVSYDQAVHYSTLKRGTIRNRVSRGTLTNVGTRGKPQLLLRTLPLAGERLFELPEALPEG